MNEQTNELCVCIVCVLWLSRLLNVPYLNLYSFIHFIFIHLSLTVVFTHNCHYIFKFQPSVFIIQVYSLWITLMRLIAFFSIHFLLMCRVVNVSSMVSKMAIDRCSEELRNQLKACTSMSDLCGFMTKFFTWVYDVILPLSVLILLCFQRLSVHWMCWCAVG